MANILNEPEEIYDINEREEASLQRLVDADVDGVEGKNDQATVTEELSRKRILEAESQRILSRVLFITTEVAYLDSAKVEKDFGSYEAVFDEIHVLVVHSKRKLAEKVIRPRKNIWSYNVHARTIIGRILKARHYIHEQFLFGDEFRPDIIVALEPTEAALLAEMTAKRYDRPWQLHVRSLEYALPMVQQANQSRWQRMITNSVFKAATSIKVSEEQIKEALVARKINSDIVQVLPHFYNLSALKKFSLSKEERLFKQFKFTILYIGAIDTDSCLYQVLDAARVLLTTPSIGLAIAGSGPRMTALRERAAMFGVEKQLLTVPPDTEEVNALASADILIVPESDRKRDELVISAASLGTAIMCARNDLRNTIFTDGESALLYDEGDIATMQQKLKKFMNDNSLRIQLRTNAKHVVSEQVVDDPALYAIAYRNAIEDVLLAKEAAIEKEEIGKSIRAAQTEASSKQVTTRDIDGVTVKLPKRI